MTLTGQITDLQGTPIPDVNIQLGIMVGTIPFIPVGKGTVTDIDGKYSLTFTGQASLKITHIGLTEPIIIPDASTTPKILKLDLKNNLPEVIINSTPKNNNIFTTKNILALSVIIALLIYKPKKNE